MEEKVIISKRFRNNALRIYQHLLKEFSVKTANTFLDRLEKRIDFIAKTQPQVNFLLNGNMSAAFYLHHTTSFFTGIRIKLLRFSASLI